jgi:hypothetical protein
MVGANKYRKVEKFELPDSSLQLLLE